MSLLRLCPLFAVIIFLTACSHQNPIVGTWSGTQTSANGTVINTTWTFTADGKSTIDSRVAGGRNANMRFGTTGTYTAQEHTLTQTALTMSDSQRTITVTRPVADTFTYSVNGDTMTLAHPKMATMTLTRQN